MNQTQQNNPSMVEPRAARRFFNRAAGHAAPDVLAREVERRMVERLQYVRLLPERLLDAGAGSGEGMRALRRRYPQCVAVAVDSAQAVLARSRSHLSLLERARRLIFPRGPKAVCADVASLPFAAGAFQLVWSNLALPWSPDPLTVFRELRRVLAPGGLLMFSSYGPDTLKELRQAFAAADAWPHTLQFPDMHDLGDLLGAAGFAQPVMDMEVLTLTYADFASLVADLRATGQLNSAQGRSRGLMGRHAFAAARQAYEGLRDGGRLPVTVEIVYGHAWRGEPRVTGEGHAVVQTDLLRKPSLGPR